MPRPHRPRLSYANVTATLALFVALGGTATAAHLVVNSTDVADEALLTIDVKGKFGTSTTPAVNGTLTGADISGQPSANTTPSQPFVDGTLTTWDMRDSTLLGRDVAANALTGADVAESTLGTVPAADRLDGYDANALSRTAQGLGPTLFGIAGSLHPLATATLNVPAAGFVTVTANAVAEDLFQSSPCGQCFVEILVRDDATGNQSYGSAGVVGANAGSQRDLEPLALSYTFPASPGARTYTLMAREVVVSGGPVGYANAAVQAEFMPFGSTGSPTVLGSASARAARSGARRTERRGDFWVREGR